ncbi:MAG: gamma carbonic anhydrase family protein [Actinomycetales bacterium]|nr:gamma carbonic anhydrase family protein [Actinomycetales bacterium]
MPIYALGDLAPVIAPTAYIHPDAVVIGDVRIGAGVSVWPMAVLRGDSAAIHIGQGGSVQDGVVIHTAEGLPTVVGDRVTIGHLAHLEGCTVAADALIGVGSVVLHRAAVGRGALIAAGAVVTPDTVVPDFAMALGVPARIKVDAVRPGAFDSNVKAYRDFTGRYPEQLRRLPDHVSRRSD